MSVRDFIPSPKFVKSFLVFDPSAPRTEPPRATASNATKNAAMDAPSAGIPAKIAAPIPPGCKRDRT